MFMSKAASANWDVSWTSCCWRPSIGSDQHGLSVPAGRHFEIQVPRWILLSPRWPRAWRSRGWACLGVIVEFFLSSPWAPYVLPSSPALFLVLTPQGSSIPLPPLLNSKDPCTSPHSHPGLCETSIVFPQAWIVHSLQQGLWVSFIPCTTENLCTPLFLPPFSILLSFSLLIVNLESDMDRAKLRDIVILRHTIFAINWFFKSQSYRGDWNPVALINIYWEFLGLPFPPFWFSSLINIGRMLPVEGNVGIEWSPQNLLSSIQTEKCHWVESKGLASMAT